MHPVLRSFFKDDHVFYGKVSYASIPSLFGGSNIPFLDKTYFQLNGDNNATFVMYISPEMNEELASWFSFASKDVENTPVEVTAARISKDRFIVKAFATKEYELDWDSVSEYQFYYSLLGLGLDSLCFIAMIVFLILGIRCKR